MTNPDETLDPETTARLVRRTLAWADALSLRPPVVRTSVRQPFGPCTAGVELLLDTAEDLDDDDLWVLAALEGAGQDGTRTAAAETDAVARTAGRSDRLRAARDAAGDALDELLEDHPEAHLLRAPVAAALRAAVGAWVVADLVDDAVFRGATASLRSWVSRAGMPEDGEPLPADQEARVRRLLAGGLPVVSDELTHEHLEAGWWLACSGRGRALVDLCVAARPSTRLDDRTWQLLCAAAVSDLRPDLLCLLPPAHRLAS